MLFEQRDVFGMHWSHWPPASSQPPAPPQVCVWSCWPSLEQWWSTLPTQSFVFGMHTSHWLFVASQSAALLQVVSSQLRRSVPQRCRIAALHRT
jgi:hypothetical protein